MIIRKATQKKVILNQLTDSVQKFKLGVNEKMVKMKICNTFF